MIATIDRRKALQLKKKRDLLILIQPLVCTLKDTSLVSNSGIEISQSGARVNTGFIAITEFFFRILL